MSLTDKEAERREQLTLLLGGEPRVKAPAYPVDVFTTDGLSGSAAFLAEAEHMWPVDRGFYHVFFDEIQVGAFCFEEAHEEDEVELSLIKVGRSFEGQGWGTKLLNQVMELADKHGVALNIEIAPSGRMDEGALIAWCERNGFERTDGNIHSEGPSMCRSPRPVLELEASSQQELLEI